jgi:hypothetical protein
MHKLTRLVLSTTAAGSLRVVAHCSCGTDSGARLTTAAALAAQDAHAAAWKAM